MRIFNPTLILSLLMALFISRVSGSEKLSFSGSFLAKSANSPSSIVAATYQVFVSAEKCVLKVYETEPSSGVQGYELSLDASEAVVSEVRVTGDSACGQMVVFVLNDGNSWHVLRVIGLGRGGKFKQLFEYGSNAGFAVSALTSPLKPCVVAYKSDEKSNDILAYAFEFNDQMSFEQIGVWKVSNVGVFSVKGTLIIP
jgi:hypothetical protein